VGEPRDRSLIFIAFIACSQGNAIEDSIRIGTESIVVASNRIIHQRCGFPHRGGGAITLATFAAMITIGISISKLVE
jgi:hypothetical protein